MHHDLDRVTGLASPAPGAGTPASAMEQVFTDVDVVGRADADESPVGGAEGVARVGDQALLKRRRRLAATHVRCIYIYTCLQSYIYTCIHMIDT